MRSAVVVCLAAVSCTGSESAPGPIDLQTPSAFDYGPYPLLKRPLPTAVGGTQTFGLTYPPTGFDPRKGGAPFDLPYQAVADDENCSLEDQSGSSITIRGLHEGWCSVAIVSEDGFTYDTLGFRMVAVASVVLVPHVPAGIANGPLAWAPGEHWFGVTPYSAGNAEPIADVSLTTALEGAELSLPFAGNGTVSVHTTKSAGTHAMSIIAGGMPWAVDYVVTDRADSIAVVPQSVNTPVPTSVRRGAGATAVCFQARFAGRTIIAPPLVLSATGVPLTNAATLLEPNANAMCLWVTPNASTGDLTVEARLGATSASLTLPVL